MSEYLRRTRSVVKFGGVVQINYGEAIPCGRITVTVRMVTPKDRRKWQRAVDRLALEPHEVSRAGPHPDSGLPRTISYSIRGTHEALRLLLRSPLIEDWSDSEGTVPFVGAGTMPKPR
jgi:hypothetical protein